MGGACGSCEEYTGRIEKSRVVCKARKMTDEDEVCWVRPQEDKVEAVKKCDVARTK